MSEKVVLLGKIEIEVPPQMRWAAYDVLSKWYSSNKLSSSGEKMMDVSDQMISAALKASTV